MDIINVNQNIPQSWNYHFIRWWLFGCELKRVSQSVQCHELMQERDDKDAHAAHFMIKNECGIVGVFRLLFWDTLIQSDAYRRYGVSKEFKALQECTCIEISRLGIVPHLRGNAGVLKTISQMVMAKTVEYRLQRTPNNIVISAMEPRFAKALKMLGYKVVQISPINHKLLPKRALYELDIGNMKS